jgi:hypothetical protein
MPWLIKMFPVLWIILVAVNTSEETLAMEPSFVLENWSG